MRYLLPPLLLCFACRPPDYGDPPPVDKPPTITLETGLFDTVDTGESCPDDPYEPNDQLSEAIALTEASGLTLSDSREDWFSLQVPGRTTASVVASFKVRQGNIDLQVLDLTGDNVAFSSSIRNNEGLSFQNFAQNEQTYLVRAYMYDAECQTYDYMVQMAPIPPEVCDDGIDNDLDEQADCRDYECIEDDAICKLVCPEDPYEDNDYYNQAVPLDASAGVGLLMAHQQDDDWFLLDVPPHTVAVVGASFTHLDGDIDLYIYDDTQYRMAWAAYIPDVEETSFVNDSDVTRQYRVQIEIWSGDLVNPCNTYTYYTRLLEPPPECEEDAIEPNDIPAQARPGLGLSEAAVTELSDDWYRFDVPALSVANLRLDFLAAYGNIDLEVWDGTGSFPYYRAFLPTQNYETLEIFNTSPQATSFLARVYAAPPVAGPFCNTYTLQIDLP